MPGKYNTEMYVGDNWQRTIVITDPADIPVDLTGYSARWQVRTDPAATTAVLAISTAGGEIVVNGTTLTASVTGAVTALLATGAYYHDLELTTPGGVVTTYLAGILAIKQDVSRP